MVNSNEDILLFRNIYASNRYVSNGKKKGLGRF